MTDILTAGHFEPAMYFLRGYGHAATFAGLEAANAHREAYVQGYEFGCAQRALALVAAAEVAV